MMYESDPRSPIILCERVLPDTNVYSSCTFVLESAFAELLARLIILRVFFLSVFKIPEVTSVKDLKLVLFTVLLDPLLFSSCGLIWLAE